MTDIPKRFTWQVEGVLRPTEDKNWDQNVNMQVVATTLEVAVAAIQAKYPGIIFIKVFRDRYLSDVIVVP